MTAPAGTVDLTLPDYATLVVRAGIDPDQEQLRVAAADPQAVQAVARSFAAAGQDIELARQQGDRAAATLGSSFTVDRAAVYGVEQHAAEMPADLPVAGIRLESSSGELGTVAGELAATQADTARRMTGLHQELIATRQSWAARVAGAGLLTPEQAAQWTAERDRLAAQMAGRVGEVGREVSGRIQAYEAVLRRAVGRFADQGFADAAALSMPAPPAPRPGQGPDPTGFGTPVTAGLAADPVNTALGNFVEIETDLLFGGLLAGLTFARTYNSRSDRTGAFGPGWASWTSTRVVPGEWAVEFEGPDGQRAVFPRTGAGGFGRAVGVDALIEPCAGPGGWVLGWFDGARWEFDAAGRLVRTWSGPGTAVEFRFDSRDRLVELAHERGRRVLIDWDHGIDRIVALTGSDGRRVEYRYDEARRLVGAVTRAGAELLAERRYELDEAGRVASVTDADGVVELVNRYDAEGRVLTQRTPFGRVVTFSYQEDGSTVVADDSAGPRNTYRHDTHGRLVALTDGHGQTQYTRYNRWGNRVEVVARGGAAVRQEFDQRAHPVRRTLPNGMVQLLDWDEHDRLTEITLTGPDTPAATTGFGYSGAERVPSEVTDPEGGVTRLTVADGLVREVVDADGVRVRFAYDRDGNLVEAVDALGGVTRVERDPDTGLASTGSTPAGRRTELAHDAAGRLVRRRDPGGGVWRFGYTRAGRSATVTDPAGSTTQTRYGPHGGASELVDALGQVTCRRLDPFGNLAGLIDPDGAKWEFRFDALSRLTAWTDPAGGTWCHEHDVDGRPTVTVDPTGVRGSVRYDPAGQLVGTDDGLVTAGYDYDGMGRPVSETRADGSTRHVEYDRCGRVIALTDPAGGVRSYTYSSAGRLVRAVSAAGREQRFEHDEAGRLVARIDSNGQRWRIGYDPDGLPVDRTSPAGLVETIDYDADGRVVRHRRPGIGTSSYTFSAGGTLIAVTDRHGRREFTYDAAGRVRTATDALGHTTSYRYDVRGHLTAVTDPLGHVTHHTHDVHGRLTSTTDPLGRTTRYVHDAAGRLRERRDPTGDRHRFRYDPSGRVAEQAVGDLRLAVSRDGLGRPVHISRSDTGPVELTWDACDRLIGQRAAAAEIGWTYDPDGYRSELCNPDGSVTRYEHDPAGALTALRHPLLGEIRLRRDPDGRLLEITGAAASSRWGYTNGWITSHTSGPPGAQLTTWLARDSHGRVLASSDSRGRRGSFGYDAAGQLISAGDQSFGYDANGRLREESGPGGRRGYRYDAAGQLVETGSMRLAYDDAGRRVAEHAEGWERHYTYDPLTGQPATVAAGSSGGSERTTRYTYNPLGQLARIDDTALAWDSTHPAEVPLAVGATAVVSVLRPWATVAPDGPHYLHPDWTGTPSAAVGADPWGSDAGVEAPSIGYRGELVDDLVWLRHRAYQPRTRTFLQTDPMPPVAGTAVAANPYHYAGNDPVNAQDPFGLRPVTDADLAGAVDGVLDWFGDNWEYVAGGALIVGGLALTATGVGGVPGVALMMAGGALASAGGSMAIQKATVGQVDYRQVGVEAAIGAVPLGAAARLAGTAARTVAPRVASTVGGQAGQLAARAQAIFGGAVPDPASSEIFYRGMSSVEHGSVRASARISPRGESFVTQDLHYVRQLAARHPDKYEVTVQFEMRPGTRDALVDAGARSSGRLLDDAGLQNLPQIAKGQSDVVHIKAEKGSITYGLRPGSADIFNDRIIRFGPLE